MAKLAEKYDKTMNDFGSGKAMCGGKAKDLHCMRLVGTVKTKKRGG